MPPDAATTPDAAKALGLHLAGYTYVGIAAELGCTPGEAYDLVRQALPADKTKPKGFVLATILGIVGAFVATYLGQSVGWYKSGESAGYLGAVATHAIGPGLAKIEPNGLNTLIAYSAKAGSTTADGGGKDSPFTFALARHLTTPGLDVRRAFGFVRDDVLKATNNRQEPFVYGSLGGDDVSPAPAPAASVAPAPNPSADRANMFPT